MMFDLPEDERSIYDLLEVVHTQLDPGSARRLKRCIRSWASTRHTSGHLDAIVLFADQGKDWRYLKAWEYALCSHLRLGDLDQFATWLKSLIQEFWPDQLAGAELRPLT